jgi:UDP-N-acetylmuramoylalanine--D-glutamate ligase
MKIAILGFGREGKSLLNFIQKRGLTLPGKRLNAAKKEIWVLDRNPRLKIPKGVKKQLGKNYLKNLSRFDIIFRSPGIPYNLPELKKARGAGGKFSSVIKLFFENCPAQIIGITGTKGKGTTSTLIYKILKAANKKVFLAGNIGKSALDILPSLIRTTQRPPAGASSASKWRAGKNQHNSTYVILELSSFQLQDLNISPHIAVVLDIFPDHQDSHQNLKEYYGAKTNIARYQKSKDLIFFSAFGRHNNRLSRWIAGKSRGRKIAVSERNFSLFKPEDLKIKGNHNFRNAVMAATVAGHLGVPKKTILKAVKNFRGLEHRLEFVRRIPLTIADKSADRRGYGNREKPRINPRKSAIIEFYNDSASTNPYTVAAAIKAFPSESKILIAGGYDKGLDYAPLARALSAKGGAASRREYPNVKLVILFGQNKKKILKAIRKSGVPIKLVNNLETAVKIAYKTAKILHSTFSVPYFIILFSPGAASFDQFQNYADRGKQFKKIVRSISAIASPKDLRWPYINNVFKQRL